MKKIGIITCSRAREVCTGAGCLKAFNQRSDYFSQYGEDTQLAAFMTCNGCREERKEEPMEDPGIQEKLERLEKERISVMHAGVCRMKDGEECKRMRQILKLIEERGIRIIRGTHRE